MPVLSTIRQEVVARNVAEGKSYREAAIIAGYSKRWASCLGSQLMQQKRLRDRVSELTAVSPRSAITHESVLRSIAEWGSSQLRGFTIKDETGEAVGFFIPLNLLTLAPDGPARGRPLTHRRLQMHETHGL